MITSSNDNFGLPMIIVILFVGADHYKPGLNAIILHGRYGIKIVQRQIKMIILFRHDTARIQSGENTRMCSTGSSAEPLQAGRNRAGLSICRAIVEAHSGILLIEPGCRGC
jgi:hypothetical protein